jgi:hypothetical protein
MKSRYTAGDCLALRRALAKNPWGLTDTDLFSFDVEVIEEMKRALREVENASDMADQKIDGWIRKWFSTGNRPEHKSGYKKIRQFLFEVPLDEVPLFMNDNFIEPFVVFRLQVGK